jgi:hypothetical protein
MSRLVHIQTTIQAVFGVLDGDGNAVPQQPITVQVHKFSEAAFAEAQQVIAAKRDEVAASSPDIMPGC